MSNLLKFFGAFLLGATSVMVIPPAIALDPNEAIAVQKKIKADRSGKKRVGKASYYHRMFNGRKMANGGRFDPNGINAASKTLPLGTYAVVTNLENDKSAVVLIEDRGPYVDGRIVDVSPRIAEELGMTEQGVVEVAVTPISVPLPDGGMRLGEAANADELGDEVASR